MLVLERVAGQKLIIGEGDREVEVQVVRVDGKHVILGITAPRDIPVDREEIRIRKNMSVK